MLLQKMAQVYSWTPSWHGNALRRLNNCYALHIIHRICNRMYRTQQQMRSSNDFKSCCPCSWRAHMIYTPLEAYCPSRETVFKRIHILLNIVAHVLPEKIRRSLWAGSCNERMKKTIPITEHLGLQIFSAPVLTAGYQITSGLKQKKRGQTNGPANNRTEKTDRNTPGPPTNVANKN